MSFSAAIATLMTIRTTAPMYFCTGHPFPIELQAVEGSIYRFPMVLWKFPYFFRPCPAAAARLEMQLMCSYITIKVAAKRHGFFNWMLLKICFETGVGKSTKMFFIRNVPDSIPWPLKVFPVMPVMKFPRKVMKCSCFFLSVCYCGSLHSESIIPCSRPNTALWRPAIRQLQSDGFLWLITFRSSASRFGCSWWFTDVL